MSDDLFSQEHPRQIELASGGLFDAYAVFIDHGFSPEDNLTPDALCCLLQSRIIFWRNERCYTFLHWEGQSPYPPSAIGYHAAYLTATDVTDIVQKFRKGLA